MKAIWRVFRYEFSRQARRRSYVFVTVGIPIVALVIFFGIQVYQQIPKGNEGQTAPGPTIAEDSPLRQVRGSGFVDLSGLIASSPFTNLRQYDSIEAARAALEADEIGAYYVIAPDYLESGRIEMYFDRFNLGNVDNTALRMLLVNSLAERSEKPIDPAVIRTLQVRRLGVSANILNDTGAIQETDEDVSSLLVYVFGLVLMLTTFTTSGYLMQSVVEEKENRMVEVLLSSMRPRDLLAGKFLSLSLLGLAQMILWGATLLFILGRIGGVVPQLAGLIITPNQVVVLAIYFVLGYLLFGAAYAAIGALATNMREGPQLAVFVTLPAVIPFYAFPIIASAPGGTLAVVLSLIPFTAPLTMVMRASISEIPLGELLLSIALLILAIILVIWVAGRLFRVNTLLSGQPPKLRDILRLVRERA